MLLLLYSILGAFLRFLSHWGLANQVLVSCPYCNPSEPCRIYFRWEFTKFCVFRASYITGLSLQSLHQGRYRHQDHEKLGQFFHLVCFPSPISISCSFKKFNLQVWRSFPYLTTGQFPHNWAIADMLKGYIAGTKKEYHHQAQEDQEGHDNSVTVKETAHLSDTSKKWRQPAHWIQFQFQSQV